MRIEVFFKVCMWLIILAFVGAVIGMCDGPEDNDAGSSWSQVG